MLAFPEKIISTVMDIFYEFFGFEEIKGYFILLSFLCIIGILISLIFYRKG